MHVDFYTIAVICNGHKQIDLFRNQKNDSMLEVVNWVCIRVQENREWISEFFW